MQRFWLKCSTKRAPFPHHFLWPSAIHSGVWQSCIQRWKCHSASLNQRHSLMKRISHFGTAFFGRTEHFQYGPWTLFLKSTFSCKLTSVAIVSKFLTKADELWVLNILNQIFYYYPSKPAMIFHTIVHTARGTAAFHKNLNAPKWIMKKMCFFPD